MGLSLKINFTWTLVGNISYAGCQWGMLIILAKLGTAETVGQFALALAITAPVMMFSYLGLRSVQAADAKGEYLTSHYMLLRIMSTIIAIAIIVTIGLCFYPYDSALLILAMGVTKSFEAISDIIYGLFQRHERMDWIAVSMIIKGVLALSALSLGLYLFKELIFGILGISLINLFVLFFYDLKKYLFLVKSSAFQFGDLGTSSLFSNNLFSNNYYFYDIYNLFKTSLPLGLAALLWSLKANVPRYYLNHYFGDYALGIYAGLVYIIMAGQMVLNALVQSALPRLANHFADGNYRQFKRLFFGLLSFAVVLGFVGLFMAVTVGNKILEIFYSREFAGYIDVFILIMIAALPNYTAVAATNSLTAIKEFKIQLYINLLIIIFNAIFGLFVIYNYGLTGAAILLICSSGMEAIISSGILLYVFNKNSKYNKIPLKV